MAKLLVGGRGGSGRSTIVTLLAQEASKRSRVLVMDADEPNLGLPAMREMMVLVCCIVLAVGLALFTAGCGGGGLLTEDPQSHGKVTVVDLAGRRVELVTPARAVVAIGPGALRLVCYAGAAQTVVGVENVEAQWGPSGRPYALAHPRLLDLPIIGQGGPDSNPDPEMLLEMGPDVIFVVQLVDGAKADELQAKSGIPVVVLSYGRLGTFDDAVLESIRLVGEITGNGARATELLSLIEGCRDDLAERTQGIVATDKPSVYVGGLSMKGTHGIESSSADYPPLTAISAKNVVDETGASGSVMIDKEKIIAWDPDIIFIDEAGLLMVEADYGKNPGLYHSLQAVRKGDVYGFLPYNYYNPNVETALADAYFMGSVVFPGSFADIDPQEKADELYRFFLGAGVYDRMAQDYGGFGKVDLASRR